ncbi:MAG: hypothetical protein QOF61_2529 [Acidobacteriota bacterium]|jgi:hypothetical protein|nr:hypothetical protein [Acidobacteriota bacterium]
MLLLCALAPGASPQTPTTTQETTPAPKPMFTKHRRIEPNLLAPELYADKLSMKFVLVDLPGASDPRSTWDGSYKLYFISEAEFRKSSEEVMRRAEANSGSATKMVGWNPTPADFPEKILLAEGSISKQNITTPQQRIHLQENIAFKEKIPAALRTKGAHLLTTYSVKVYDARLKVPVYDNGIFMTFPFDDQTDPEKITPRTVVYTNFYVSPKGEVWESQLPRKDGDTSWF